METLVSRVKISKGEKITRDAVTDIPEKMQSPHDFVVDEVFPGGSARLIWRDSPKDKKYSSILVKPNPSEQLAQVTLSYVGAYMPLTKMSEKDCKPGIERLNQAGL